MWKISIVFQIRKVASFEFDRDLAYVPHQQRVGVAELSDAANRVGIERCSGSVRDRRIWCSRSGETVRKWPIGRRRCSTYRRAEQANRRWIPEACETADCQGEAGAATLPTRESVPRNKNPAIASNSAVATPITSGQLNCASQGSTRAETQVGGCTIAKPVIEILQHFGRSLVTQADRLQALAPMLLI